VINLYVVFDSGRPVSAFTDKADLRTYLWRMHATFNRPLVYRFDDGDGPVIMTVSRLLGGALDAQSLRRRARHGHD
jgi:hypothetical protein